MKLNDLLESRWEVLQILQGRPGHSTVTLFVQDVTSGDEYVVKTPNTTLSAGSNQLERFRHEAVTWIRLGPHPNVAQAKFLRMINSLPFLFIEFMEGGDLSRLIASGELNGRVDRVIPLGLQLCSALSYAAKQGMQAHGDIKPNNCLLDSHGALKLTDFGMTRFVTDSDLEIDVTTDRSPIYMAPEQFTSSNRYDISTDIYQFGILLFELLVGDVPFPGDSWREVMLGHCSAEPPSLSSYSELVHEIVMRCLAKSPSERFYSFDAIHEQLTKAAALHGIQYQVAGISPKSTLQSARDGSQLLVLGDPSAAIEQLTSSLNASPDEVFSDFQYALAAFPEVAAAARAMFLVTKAVALIQLAKYRDAFDHLEAALQLSQDLWLAWLIKGDLELRGGRPAVALDCFERVLQLDSRNRHALIFKIETLLSTGRRSDAAECLRSAATRFPDDPVFRRPLADFECAEMTRKVATLWTT